MKLHNYLADTVFLDLHHNHTYTYTQYCLCQRMENSLSSQCNHPYLAFLSLRNEGNMYFNWCRSTYKRVLHEYFTFTRCRNL